MLESFTLKQQLETVWQELCRKAMSTMLHAADRTPIKERDDARSALAAVRAPAVIGARRPMRLVLLIPRWELG